MRHISQQGLDLIKFYEEFSAVPYICPAGYSTIGFGHLIKPDEHFNHIDLQEAEKLLSVDVQIAERSVLKMINVPLTVGQFDALVSFTFNLGSGALQRSTLRRRVNGRLHLEVPAELQRWVYARGKKLKGLVRRRLSESILYLQ